MWPRFSTYLSHLARIFYLLEPCGQDLLPVRARWPGSITSLSQVAKIYYLFEPGGNNLAEADVAVVELKNLVVGAATSLTQPAGHQGLPVTCA